MKSIAPPLIKLTVFILVTVLATGVLALTILNSSFKETNSYTARFTDVASLNPGDDVRIAGVRVGQVDDVEIVDKNLADVEFSVEKQIKLPATVHAAIKYRNLIGQRFVSLEQSAQPDSGGTLPPDGRIGLEHTKPALDLTTLFNGFQPLFAALSPNDVNKLSFEVIQVLQGQGGTVDSLLAHTASLTSTIANKDQVIGRVIDNLNSVLDTVNARRGELSDLIVTVQQLVHGLAEDRKPIGEAVSSLSGLADTTSGLLRDVRAPLKSDIGQLGRLTDNLNGSQQLVESFVQGLPGKLQTLTRTASYGSWFNFFLCGAGGKAKLPVIGDLKVPAVPATQPRCTS
jgi:phospholipid/cholesterol/gamma-HCH transport system substrate-binding protein